MRKLITLALLLSSAACSGGGSNQSQVPIVTPSPTPAPTAAPAPAPTPTPTSTPPPTPAPTPTPTPSPSTGPDNVAAAASLYVSPPSAANCVAGQLTSTVTAQVLIRINEIRALHRLPAVGYSNIDEPAAQQAALMMAANNELNHTPPPSWRCYTALGAAGAGSSNLALRTQSPSLALQTDDSVLGGWMDEINNIVANNVGHRRWILNPFGTTMSYGRAVISQNSATVLDAVALRVFNTSGAAPASTVPLPAYVAYPFGDYPARYFNVRSLLSFGVIASTAGLSANSNVSYAAATIRVTLRGGADLAVSNISSDTVGFGLPNNLQFTVAGLAINSFYDVAIGNVRVNGQTMNYSYSFRIVP